MPNRRPEPLPPALEGEIAHVVASPTWAKADNTARARLVLDVVHRALRSPGWELADTYRRVLRDKQIRDDFDGTNTFELAARYRLTTRQVRRIVAPRRRRK